jgi:transposase-like protein
MAKRYDEEFKGRAVRLVAEHGEEYDSHWACIAAVAKRLGVSTETLRRWVNQDQVDSGRRDGLPTDTARELRELKRKNKELEETIEILRAAASFFARESDPRRR